MNEETKKLIEELKGIVLDMYRSAGDLDQWIQQLESVLNDEDMDADVLNTHVKMLMSYRMQVKYNKGFRAIETKEDSIWTRLTISTSPDWNYEKEQES